MSAPQQLPANPPKNILSNEEKQEMNDLEHKRKMKGTGKVDPFTDSERNRLSELMDKEGRE